MEPHRENPNHHGQTGGLLQHRNHRKAEAEPFLNHEQLFEQIPSRKNVWLLHRGKDKAPAARLANQKHHRIETAADLRRLKAEIQEPLKKAVAKVKVQKVMVRGPKVVVRGNQPAGVQGVDDV